VKLFIRRPTAAQELLPKVLKLATEEAENPDLRDRVGSESTHPANTDKQGFMYWRLLTTNPTAARDIVLSEKPVISTETDRMDKGMLDQLLLHTGTLGSIYHKNPSVSSNPLACLVADLKSFIRTARSRYLPDSPALNASSRRHLITPLGAPASTRPTSAPKIPQRPEGLNVATAVGAGAAGGAGAMLMSPTDDNDPYGLISDLDFINLGGAGGGGGGYETDRPRPKEEEDLLF